MTHAIDVTDETFEQVVIEGSKTTPVVVDLWAAWCGPCRTLGPMLEKVAKERDGAFTLAKIDVDAQEVGNALLSAVKSQSIPTVIAFRDGQPVSMFIGSYPEEELNRFVDSILPSEAEIEAEAAAEILEAGDEAEAEAGFRDALDKEPDNREAGLGLARMLLRRGDLDEARPLVMRHLPDPDAEHLHALLEVAEWAGEPPDGTLGAAKRAAATGDWQRALDGMIAALGEDRDPARQALVTVFAALGEEHSLVPEYRRRLAAALF
ncbi:MAG: tetratricopeptide repeat protein [Actinomycetota bacterium]